MTSCSLSLRTSLSFDMASSSESLYSKDESLSKVFDHAFKRHNEVVDSGEDTRSEEFQKRLQRTIMAMEDATRLVSVLDIFSRNETVSEVPTEHLKYFLLPAMLSNLHGKLAEDPQDRIGVIRIQETYLRDFIKRCNDYDIVQVQVPAQEEDKDEDSVVGGPPQRPDLAKMTKEREEKMRRYKEQKSLEERLKVLEESMEAQGRDEDVVREFYLKTIQRFVNQALDDLASFAMEKPILRHMQRVRSGQVPQQPPRQQPRRPLKPVIITKDAIQKEVFGMGYKNLPVLSIEEFYEQRVREGWFPAPGTGGGRSLQDQPRLDQKEQEEEEARLKEEAEERDDQEELERKRNMDEYKDDHRRGEGNRHNKG